MKVIGKGKEFSASEFIVEMSAPEIEALTGCQTRRSHVEIGQKFKLKKEIDEFYELRRQFRDLGATAKHLREVADKMEEFELPKWSKSW